MNPAISFEAGSPLISIIVSPSKRSDKNGVELKCPKK
jgi:hypothetical protein